MSNGFEVRGADQVAQLSRALRDAGRTELRKELHAALRSAAKPLIDDTRAEARRRLPKRGGLATAVAKAPQRIMVGTGRDPAVRIVVSKTKSGARAANAGVVRHPVFGSDIWVEQKVRPGWFDEPLQAGAKTVRPKLEQALEDVADKVVRSAGGA